MKRYTVMRRYDVKITSPFEEEEEYLYYTMHSRMTGKDTVRFTINRYNGEEMWYYLTACGEDVLYMDPSNNWCVLLKCPILEDEVEEELEECDDYDEEDCRKFASAIGLLYHDMMRDFTSPRHKPSIKAPIIEQEYPSLPFEN